MREPAMREMSTLADVEDVLSEPSSALVEDLGRCEGDLCILGAAGKLGPSLVRLACRAVAAAGTGARVIAVSRFGDPATAEQLERDGAVVLRADVADDAELAGLPEAANVIFLVGSKFGTTGQEAATWATNAYLPGRVAQRFGGSRLVALSTGNVYPLTGVQDGGSVETDPVGPVGEYAMSCLGRERVLTHLAEQQGSELALIRLNYAVEMRYGVLVDLAVGVREGRPIDLTTGYANVVWQGYANEVILRSLLHATRPPLVLNLTGPETISIRDAARQMAELMDRPVRFTGTESDTALLSDAGRCHRLFGPPQVSATELVEQTARWVADGGPLLGKPTHFESRDGRF